MKPKPRTAEELLELLNPDRKLVSTKIYVPVLSSSFLNDSHYQMYEVHLYNDGTFRGASSLPVIAGKTVDELTLELNKLMEASKSEVLIAEEIDIINSQTLH